MEGEDVFGDDFTSLFCFSNKRFHFTFLFFFSSLLNIGKLFGKGILGS